MSAIRINVNKQLDGYTFSTTPSIRELIKKLSKFSSPNNIFIAYDTKSNFELYVSKLDDYIFPVLLGIDQTNDLKKIGQIEYIDTQTGKTHKVTPSFDKEI